MRNSLVTFKKGVNPIWLLLYSVYEIYRQLSNHFYVTRSRRDVLTPPLFKVFATHNDTQLLDSPITCDGGVEGADFGWQAGAISAPSNALTKFPHWIIQIHALFPGIGSVLRIKRGCPQTWSTSTGTGIQTTSTRIQETGILRKPQQWGKQ